MKLQEIFDNLSTGELSQLSIGGEDAGILNESNWPKILSHVNLGLTAIYKRFTIKEGELVMNLVSAQTQYALHSDYSILSTRRPLEAKFIVDTVAHRFADDIIKVERVYTDLDAELALNNIDDKYSLSTPTMKSLRIPLLIAQQGVDLPEVYQTSTLRVVYRATHQKITIPLGYFNPEVVEVELPDTHLVALLYYVASRVNNPVGMVNEFNAGNSWYAKYEAACQELEHHGMYVSQDSQNTRAARAGWV
jgi:hypothetical protein